MKKINAAESYEKIYNLFGQINFTAWDYFSIKQSLLDNLKLYYPENFNDYIETGELVTIIESFAYIAEMLAYRFDMNANENILQNAQRKESVLRLAKFLSYPTSRNIPGRGLIKIKTISTTERIFDNRGVNLTNKNITWGDTNNPFWKEQFIIVMNRVLDQQFGTVLSSDRVQVEDVLIELYGFNNEPLYNNVIKFNATVSGNSYPVEIVSAELNEFGPVEKRHEKNQKLNVLFLNDGLGDNSDNTGFFLFVKQGELQRSEFTVDGVTPNQFIDFGVENCNQTDIWVNNIDPVTKNVIENTDIRTNTRIDWEQVDLANSQNILFNTSENRNKYEVETLDADRFRLIFGDGKFATIPSGLFEVWYRVSKSVVIPTNAIQNAAGNIEYFDDNNNGQTFSFQASLLTPIQNSAPSEAIDKIRRTAPSVYYTQDRMVNGKDYNEYMLKDNSILKLKSVNRTFAGDSKYINWFDAHEYYENVKIFGDDMVIYFLSSETEILVNNNVLPQDDFTVSSLKIKALIENHLQPILNSEEMFFRNIYALVSPVNIRKAFNSTELTNLRDAFRLAIDNTPLTFYMSYNTVSQNWDISYTAIDDYWIKIENLVDNSWIFYVKTNKLIFNSQNTKFTITNKNQNIVTYDILRSNLDQIVILSANLGPYNNVLGVNYFVDIYDQQLIDTGQNAGLYSQHELFGVSADTDNDGSPNNVRLEYLFTSEDYVYFKRDCLNCEWVFQPTTADNLLLYQADVESEAMLWKRENGKANVNFLWLHRTPRYHLIDPSPSNIIDTFILTRGYYENFKLWTSNRIAEKPKAPTNFNLQTDYNNLLDNKMISDSVILHPAKLKLIIGSKAIPELQATLKIIKSNSVNLTTNQIKTAVVSAVEEFFEIEFWEFGKTFYFSELATYIHSKLINDIDSVVLVPKLQRNVFGDLYQIYANDDEIIQPSISVSDITIVESLDPFVLKQNV